MREPARDKNLLEDIIQAVDYATEFVKDFTFEQFVQDKRTYFAVVKNMEIIGEASYKLTLEFKDSHPEVEWKIIINMRHVLVHGYADIVPSVLWDTIHNDLPPFKNQVLQYIEAMR